MSDQREFFVSKNQLEYYKQMKMTLNNIDEESKLYQIWKNQGMLVFPDYQTLFSTRREERIDNEKRRSRRFKKGI